MDTNLAQPWRNLKRDVIATRRDSRPGLQIYLRRSMPVGDLSGCLTPDGVGDRGPVPRDGAVVFQNCEGTLMHRLGLFNSIPLFCWHHRRAPET